MQKPAISRPAISRRLFLIGALATAAVGAFLLQQPPFRTVIETSTVTRETTKVVTSVELALRAPVLLSPADGTVFSHYPRTTTLRWAPVPGADRYDVEVDYYSDGQWYSWFVDVTGGTTYTFEFLGAQPGRWRVWAFDEAGQEGPRSDWWYFEYTV